MPIIAQPPLAKSLRSVNEKAFDADKHGQKHGQGAFSALPDFHPR
jgi:hypothetical protein